MKKVYDILLSSASILIGLVSLTGLIKICKDHINYTNSSSFSVRSELEVKVDSLKDKKNCWVGLKNSPSLVELANNFIGDYDEQIKTLEDSISKIERSPEFKNLKKKAFLYE